MPNSISDATNWILPVILAGGSGTRLWPLSRKHHPKQYLELDDSITMLQSTITRLADLSCASPFVICSEETRFLAAEQLREIGQNKALILLEPVGRNTAPAIALAALEAVANGDDPILLVMPADHKIKDLAAFTSAVNAALPLALSNHLVTFGIMPDRPETGYGYIRSGTPISGSTAYTVNAFFEKPDLATAECYIAAGGYFWNSGIFLIRASSYLAQLEMFCSDILHACRAAHAGRVYDLHFVRFNEAAFLACPDVSIDYAVMEKTTAAVVVPLDAGWSDIGTWSSLYSISDKDNNANVIKGDVIVQDTSNSYINTSHHRVVAIGMNDLVIVNTANTTFVARKDKAHKIKGIIDNLQEND